MTNKQQKASETAQKQEVEKAEKENSSAPSKAAENTSKEGKDSEKEADSSEKAEEKEVDREKQLAKELEDTKRRYLTALADYQNLQKRTSKVQSEARDRGVADFLKRLLPVVDTLDKAMEMCSKSDLDKKVMDGLEMFSIQFSDMLSKEGLKEIEAMGKKFDPNLHEAMCKQNVADKGDEEVVQVFEKGYQFKELVLRCAKVVVNQK